jgi:hypothetical protein
MVLFFDIHFKKLQDAQIFEQMIKDVQKYRLTVV